MRFENENLHKAEQNSCFEAFLDDLLWGALIKLPFLPPFTLLLKVSFKHFPIKKWTKKSFEEWPVADTWWEVLGQGRQVVIKLREYALTPQPFIARVRIFVFGISRLILMCEFFQLPLKSLTLWNTRYPVISCAFFLLGLAYFRESWNTNKHVIEHSVDYSLLTLMNISTYPFWNCSESLASEKMWLETPFLSALTFPYNTTEKSMLDAFLFSSSDGWITNVGGV